MILSLASPKRRVECREDLVYFNDFNNTLFVEYQGKQEPVALNLGPSNWTVSPKGEVSFLFWQDGKRYLAIVDPISHTRIFQELDQTKILNLLLTEDSFYLAIPGNLLQGKRLEDGGLAFKGRRALDFGGQFMFWQEDGVLNYTKRGHGKRFEVKSLKEKRSVVDHKNLWWITFYAAYLDGFIPPAPEGEWTLEDAVEELVRRGESHKLTEAGVRLHSLLSRMLHWGLKDVDCLEKMLEIDWSIQYYADTNDKFPSLELMRKILPTKQESELVVPKVIPVRMMKWSGRFEDANSIGKRAKPLNNNAYTDRWVCGGEYLH